MSRHSRRPPEVDQQLLDAVATLDRSGAAKWFYTIRRRRPPSHLWSYWKRDMPIDSVTDLRSLCAEGGEDYEYRIQVHDQNHGKAIGPDQRPIEDRVIPATVSEQPESPGVPDDPIFADRMRELEARRREMEIRRREIAMAREEERLARMEGGEQDPGAEEYDYNLPAHDPRLRFDPRMPPWGGGGPFFYGPPPWLNQQPQRDNFADTLKLVTALVAAMAPHKGESSIEIVKTILPLLGTSRGGLEPKDMLGFVSPIVASLANAQAEASKMMLQSMADSDNLWKEKLLDMAKLGGASDDDVDRIGKILSRVGDIGVNVIRTIKGGKPEKKVEVPVLRKSPSVALPPPGTGPNPAGTDSSRGAPSAAGTDPVAVGTDPGYDAAAEARKAVLGRVEIFLLAHEQEMLAGSDPGWVVDQLSEAMASLPADLREKMDTGKTSEIYDALRQYKSDIVDRIFTAVAADKSGRMKGWCDEFWEIYQNPPQDAEGEEGEGEDEKKEGEAGGENGGNDDHPHPES